VSEPVAGFPLAEAPVLDPGQFPIGGNLELVRVIGERAIEMRVYERGSGETQSCGTGAVAAAVAAATAAGEWPDGPERDWSVRVPGGGLAVRVSTTASLLTGPAVIVAEGVVNERWLADLAVPVSATA
jgi:diaminopimelate epimerase